MKSLYTFLVVSFLLTTFCQGQIIISEIMYNSPESGNDSLEYIELYNASDLGINMNGYSFSQGVDYSFSDTTVAAQSYIVVAVNSRAMNNVFGFSPLQWTGGALSNSGEDIIINDGNGNVIDVVDYSPNAPWPTFAEGTNGGGASIEFCFDTSDNSDATNWKASTALIGIVINQSEVRGTPGKPNSVTCGTVADATVILSGFKFSPADITINLGQTVLWKNQGGTHNINGSLETFPNNPDGFFSGTAQEDPFEFLHTFTVAGIYNYQCDPHVEEGMVGTVTVVEEKPNLVISEILYNHPSIDDVDELEFVEIYNAGENDVNLNGFQFTSKDISLEMPETILEAGKFLILQKQYSDFIDNLGLETLSWDNGNLNDIGDSLSLWDANGELLDLVVYSSMEPWDEAASENGKSLSLCNINGDNTDPENWQSSSSQTLISFGDTLTLYANPGSLNACVQDIATATMVDADGVSILDGNRVKLQGVVYGTNLRPGGLQFTLIDSDNQGIAVYSATRNFGYEVLEGDNVMIEGMLDQFNGLIQIYIDTLIFGSANNQLVHSDTITILGEAQESSLVTIENVKLVSPSEWSNANSSSGFNVRVTNGTETFQLRIDNDVADLFNGGYPDGTFNVTGIGGQFDSSFPYTEGYQLLPRYAEDISPYVPFTDLYPLKTIAEVSQINENGATLFEGLKCEIIGTTYGINFRPSGLQFTIIGESNDGMGLFNSSGNLGYEFQEGDEVSIKGTISQFNGLVQINPDSIKLLSSGNSLFEPTIVSVLNEDSESQLIKILGASVVNPDEWAGDGSSFNVDVMTPAGETISIRIDSDCELSTMQLPGTLINITGLGGQFDSQEPYDSGYQLYPRYASDIEMSSNVLDHLLTEKNIIVYPNPLNDVLQIESLVSIYQVRVYNIIGQLVLSKKGIQKQLDLSGLQHGNYFIQFITKDGIITKEIVKL